MSYELNSLQYCGDKKQQLYSPTIGNKNKVMEEMYSRRSQCMH